MLRPVYSFITGDLRTVAGCPLFDYFFGVIMNNFKKKIKRKREKMLAISNFNDIINRDADIVHW